MSELNLDAPMCQAPNPLIGTPRIAPPRGACDCHAHVFGPSSFYSLAPLRAYTPPDSPVTEYLRMLSEMGLSHGVLTQPGVYGADNSCLLDALDAARGRLCGIVALDVIATDDESLRAMTARGVRGLRVSVAPEKLEPGKLRRLARRIEAFGWHLDLVPGRPAKIITLLPELEDLAVPVVIEGMGMVTSAVTPGFPGFQALLKLMQTGNVWVKLSHVYKISLTGMPYRDVDAFPRELLAVNPGRLVWGTDWPHPGVTLPMPCESVLFDLFCDWVPDPELRRQILVRNPAVLYGFTLK